MLPIVKHYVAGWSQVYGLSFCRIGKSGSAPVRFGVDVVGRGFTGTQDGQKQVTMLGAWHVVLFLLAAVVIGSSWGEWRVMVGGHNANGQSE